MLPLPQGREQSMAKLDGGQEFDAVLRQLGQIRVADGLGGSLEACGGLPAFVPAVV